MILSDVLVQIVSIDSKALFEWTLDNCLFGKSVQSNDQLASVMNIGGRETLDISSMDKHTDEARKYLAPPPELVVGSLRTRTRIFLQAGKVSSKLLSAFLYGDGYRLEMLDTKTGQQEITLTCNRKIVVFELEITQAIFSPSGTRLALAFAGNDNVFIYDVLSKV